MVLLVMKANVDFAVWNMVKMKEKKKRVLFVATVDSHIELFHLPYPRIIHNKNRGI